MRALWPWLIVILLGCSPAPVPQEDEVESEQADELTLEVEDIIPDPLWDRNYALQDVWPVLSQPWGGDLNDMLERGEIRVLTSFTLGWYYIDQGQPTGLTYESTKLFEAYVHQQLGEAAKRLKITVIPVRRDQLIPYLKRGYGDLIFANMTITEQRAEQVAFSEPYSQEVREVLVTGENSEAAADWASALDWTITVRRESSYYQSLKALNAQRKAQGLKPLTIRLADPRLEDEDLLEMVAAGYLQATVVDEHKLEVWREVLPQLVVHSALPLRQGGELGIAMRKDSPQLQALVNDYVKANPVGSKTVNVLINRYLRSPVWAGRALERDPFHKAAEYIPLFKKYGEQYDFDWVLLMAFAFQESRFDPNARSPVGAVGIMQLMPATARDKRVNINNIEQVENNIHAGTKYLDVLRSLYFADDALTEFNRMIFAMAAYNAGPNRINRLRREAAQRGLDPNVWFNNVEDLVAAQVGTEPVNYVANIYRYFVTYKRVLKEREERETIRGHWQGSSSEGG
ncbi:transglycosylase SLT domain-containing protein [Ferrimonas pelagia]|uniref:Lytic transglycosylase F n=1 Tax=Ferrimonas pelagia TaxID=1177826 RepID=A0ABP9F1U1_9GAMM